MTWWDLVRKYFPNATWDSPIHWLLDYTGCVAVYYTFCIYPKAKKITMEQEEVINKLKEYKFIKLGE